MPEARYFLPDHPDLKGEYSRDDLRILLKSGKVSRSEMVLDDETGLAHLLGALLVSPYYLSPHHGSQQVNDEEEEDGETAKGGEEDDPAPKEKSSPATSVPEPDEEEIDEINEVENGEHMEFRATSPLRQWESPALEVDHYGEEPDEEEDEDEDDEIEDEEEEEHSEPPEASAPQPATVFRAAMPQEEELLFHGHPSWLSYPKSLAAFVAFSAVSILCQRLHFGLAWCVTAAALALLCLAFVALDRMTTEYFISTRRVEMESGLIGRSTKEIRIADIRAIDVTQKGFNAVLGVGTLDFFSSAGGQSDVSFANVYRPHRLKQTVRDLQV